MTLLISTVGKTRGSISQDSLWTAPRWMPWRQDGMRRKITIFDDKRMAIGVSGLVVCAMPMVAAARHTNYKGFDDFAHDLPKLWIFGRPTQPCQVVVIGWSEARGRVMGCELYAAPDADPTFDEVLIGTKLDDDLDPDGRNYREIRKLAGFVEAEPTIAYVEHLHRLCAANILDASRRGFYGRDFAGGPVDFATLSRDGVTVRHLDLAALAAA